MSGQLQQVGGILDSLLAEILTKAQVLTAHKTASGAVAAVATNWRPSRREGSERASKKPPPGSGGFRGKCFECGGHTWRDIARSRPREPYSVIAAGRKDTLLCRPTAVRGRGRETAAPAVILPQE